MKERRPDVDKLRIDLQQSVTDQAAGGFNGRSLLKRPHRVRGQRFAQAIERSPLTVPAAPGLSRSLDMEGCARPPVDVRWLRCCHNRGLVGGLLVCGLLVSGPQTGADVQVADHVIDLRDRRPVADDPGSGGNQDT